MWDSIITLLHDPHFFLQSMKITLLSIKELSLNYSMKEDNTKNWSKLKKCVSATEETNQ